MSRLLLALVMQVVLSAPVGGQVRTELGQRLDAAASVRVHTLAGRVTVTGWDRDSIDVRAVAPREVRVLAGGSRTAFKVGTYEGLPAAAPFVELTIRVPRGAQLWIRTTSAPVTVRGFTGSLDVNTITGEVRVEGSPADLRVASMRGRVEVTGTPRWLRVRTGTGDVAFDGSATDVAISSVSGSIRSPAGTARGRLETVQGTITVTRLPSTAAPLDVDSHQGSVVLLTGARANASFTLFSAQGRITNALSPASARKLSGTGSELRFSIGTPGARVTVRTFSGSIRLAPR